MKWIKETKRGYKFDKRLFWIFTLIIVGYCLYLMSLYDFNFDKQLYLNCPKDPTNPLKMCKNPIPESNLAGYCKEEWCKQELLSPGEYGRNIPQEMFTNFAYLVWGGLLVMLILNHLIHNKGKKFDAEIVVWKDKVINIDTLKKIKIEDDKVEGNKNNSIEPKN